MYEGDCVWVFLFSDGVVGEYLLSFLSSCLGGMKERDLVRVFISIYPSFFEDLERIKRA